MFKCVECKKVIIIKGLKGFHFYVCDRYLEIHK